MSQPRHLNLLLLASTNLSRDFYESLSLSNDTVDQQRGADIEDADKTYIAPEYYSLATATRQSCCEDKKEILLLRYFTES
ncbi:hypothetical protein NXS19_013239 [Fusarium pseudograminearum]|nr:hypothetical protein NXS19_013239 [Fusarium pseudograminearum]